MKKLFLLATVLVIAVLSACQKDKRTFVAADITPPAITAPVTGESIAVTVSDSSQIFTVSWSKPNYGVSAVISYFVQIDSLGKKFKTFVNIGNLSSANTVSLSYNVLNNELMNPLGLTPNAASTIEVRVGSAIYGSDTVYSKPLSIAFTSLQLDQLWLPGSYQNYSPATAPAIPSVIAKTTYEGFAYFSAAGNFKFTSAPDYNHINYGYASAGMLTTNGTAGGIGYSSAGVYLLDANVQALTYDAQYIQSFGIIGTATAGQWNSSTPMTYNTATGLWTITTSLTAGALKFRANDAWTINYGPTNPAALSGPIVFNNPNSINITTAGTYTITMDMTQTTQKAYLYSVVQN